MAESVLVLNASYEYLAYVEWERAVTMVVNGTVDVVESDPERSVRSTYLEVPWPRVVALRRYVYVEDIGHGGDGVLDVATRKGVLLRDRNRCVYCNGSAGTVDHVFPRSRGGRDTWENLVACCSKCNHAKADRTPQEAGMRLLWQPYRPDSRVRTQRRVWREHVPVT